MPLHLHVDLENIFFMVLSIIPSKGRTFCVPFITGMKKSSVDSPKVTHSSVESKGCSFPLLKLSLVEDFDSPLLIQNIVT